MSICFSPGGTQPRIAVIFKGKGKRISAVEKEAWDPDIDIYFQPNGWGGVVFCTEWAKVTLKPAVQGKHHFFLLFFALFKNLEGEQNPKFKDAVSSCGGIVWYGLANATDNRQPVDAGYGQRLEGKKKQEFFTWLDDDENCERWYGQAMFTASEKRILITKWVEDAYREFLSSKHDDLHYSWFQKTGCLSTIDGSDDKFIQSEGLPNYLWLLRHR